MEISQLKRSVSEIAKTLGAIVEEKLGDRSQVEEQVRQLAHRVEKVVSDAVGRRAPVSIQIKVKTMPHFNGELPVYKTAGSSGLDVRAAIEEPVVLEAGQRQLISTGLSVEIPMGYEIQVRPRSGWAISHGIGLVNSPGTIDADYRGEIKVIVINMGHEPVQIQPQDRIAQLVVCPVVHAEIVMADDLSDTDRGAGGFGSTGAE